MPKNKAHMMINKNSLHNEKNQPQASEQTAYISDLIKQTLKLRNKYFDSTWNLVDLGNSGHNIKNIVNELFLSDQNIQEAIHITSSEKAKECFAFLQDDMLAIFSHLLTLSQHESRNKALGHDSTHAAYDGYEMLEYTPSIQDPIERIATYFGSLAHDLGRPDEVEFKWWQVNDEHHALYALMYIFQELRNHSRSFCARNTQLSSTEKEEIETISKAFFKRVINAVIVHSWFNDTRDPVFHHVQSLDRLAGIMWQRFFVRILLADGIHLHKPLYSPTRWNYAEKIPAALDVKTPYSIFHKTEQFMRWTFHKPVSLSLDTADSIIDERTRQSMAILYLMSWWKDHSSLYQQTFFPESQDSSSDERNHKDKKWVLPDKFKKLIHEHHILTDEEKGALEKIWTYSIEDYCRIMLKQQSMFLQEKEIQHFIDYIQENISKDAHYKSYMTDTLRYVIVRRELDRVEEKARIEANLETTDPFKSLLAKNLSHHPLWTQSLDEILETLQK